MTIAEAAAVLESADRKARGPLTELQLAAVMVIGRAYKQGEIGRETAAALLGRVDLHVPPGPFG